MFVVAQMKPKGNLTYLADVVIARISDKFINQTLSRWQNVRAQKGMECATFNGNLTPVRFVLVPLEAYDSDERTTTLLDYVERKGVVCAPVLPPALDAMWHWPLPAHIRQYEAHGVEEAHFPKISATGVKIYAEETLKFRFVAKTRWSDPFESVEISGDNLEGKPSLPDWIV